MSTQDIVCPRGRFKPERWFGLAICNPKMAFGCRRELKISEAAFRDPMHKKLYKCMVDLYVVTAPNLELPSVYDLMVKNKITIGIIDLLNWCDQAFEYLPLPWGMYCDFPRQPPSPERIAMWEMAQEIMENGLLKIAIKAEEEKAFAERMAAEVAAPELPAPEPVTYDNLPL